MVAFLGAACLPRPARRRQGGGASISQDLDPAGEGFANESFCEGEKGGAKHPPEAKPLGNRAWTKQTRQTEQTDVPPLTNCNE